MDEKLDECRGLNKWEGMLPEVEGPREWDEDFQKFLMRYGTFNHIVYDVFVNREKDKKGVRGSCRYDEDLDAFSRDGLWFKYIRADGEEMSEYDFTGEYSIVSNMVCSPRSFFTAEDNWFGFIALSTDETELVVVFRGTQTTKEWLEDATLFMEQLEGEEPEHGFAWFFNRKDLMFHRGFHQLYTQEGVSGAESPKATVRRLVEEHKETLTHVTVIGHSLGGAMCQLCAFDLVHFGITGDIPVTALAWGSPKIANGVAAQRAEELHPKLRILRIREVHDFVCKVPPDWLFSLTQGGYRHMGQELKLSNSCLKNDGLVRNDEAGANHNLEMYLHMINPERDPALMNKVGNVLPDGFLKNNRVNPNWHNQSWPRTIF